MKAFFALVILASMFAPEGALSATPKKKSRRFPDACYVVFETENDARAACPASTPVIPIDDFWTNLPGGFVCMCGVRPDELHFDYIIEN